MVPLKEFATSPKKQISKMYELYPEYSTIHDNYFFALDERSMSTFPKLSSEEIEEVRNDWFEGLRRLGQERRYEVNERLNKRILQSDMKYGDDEEYDEGETDNDSRFDDEDSDGDNDEDGDGES